MTGTDAERRLLDELLGPLHMRFLGARSAYRSYLDEGRAFLFARSLRRINAETRALLLDKGHLLPEGLQTCAVELVGHFDAWMSLWDEHAERTRPAAGDAFAFENRFTYPREAEQRLEALYEQLRAGGKE
jgi:hypothetical protein